MQIRRYWYQFLKLQDYQLGIWSCSMMQKRRFADRPIHPKHLFDESRSEYVHGLVRQGDTFLDLGSGVGTECLQAAQAGAAISIGVEIKKDSIITAKDRTSENGNTAYYLQVELEDGLLPFVDNTFDVVNFSNVLEHLDSRIPILRELKRVKKTKGIAVLSIPNNDTSWKKKLRKVGLDSRDDPDHRVEYSRSSILKEVQLAGLEISSELMPIIPSWPWNGMIAMSAAISPRLYKKMQRYKRDYVATNPGESIGWVFTVQ